MLNEQQRSHWLSLRIAMIDHIERIKDISHGFSRLSKHITNNPDSIDSLESRLRALQTLELTMVVAGPMKVGKSTFFNALTGLDILPSHDGAMTFLPTKIILVKDKIEPQLHSDPSAQLYYHALSKSLAQVLRSTRKFDEVLFNSLEDLDRRERLTKVLHQSSWLPSLTQGVVKIRDTLSILYDLSRVSSLLSVTPPDISTDSEIFPCLKISNPFHSQLLADGNISFIDTPGYNESRHQITLTSATKKQIQNSGISIIMLPYMGFQSKDVEILLKYIENHNQIYGKHTTIFIINRIDERKGKGSLDKAAIANRIAHTLNSNIEDIDGFIFELSANNAFLAGEFLREYHRRASAGTTPTDEDVRIMPSAQALLTAICGTEAVNFAAMMDSSKYLDMAYRQRRPLEDFIAKAIDTLSAQVVPITIRNAFSSALPIANELRSQIVSFRATLNNDIGLNKKNLTQLRKQIEQLESTRDEIGKKIESSKKELKSIVAKLTAVVDNLSDSSINDLFGYNRRADHPFFNHISKHSITGKSTELSDYKIRSFGPGRSIKFDNKDTAMAFAQVTSDFIIQHVESNLEFRLKSADSETENIAYELTKFIKIRLDPILTNARRFFNQEFNIPLNFTSPNLGNPFEEVINHGDHIKNIPAHTESRSYKEKRWYTLYLYNHIVYYTQTVDEAFEVSFDGIKESVNNQVLNPLQALLKSVQSFTRDEFGKKISSYIQDLNHFLASYEMSIHEAQLIQEQGGTKIETSLAQLGDFERRLIAWIDERDALQRRIQSVSSETGQPPAILILHAKSDSRDADLVERHLATLRSAGVKVFRRKDIPLGQKIGDVMRQWLDSARMVLALLSADFFAESHDGIDNEALLREACRTSRQGSGPLVVPVCLTKSLLPDYLKELRMIPGDGTLKSLTQDQAETELAHLASIAETRLLGREKSQ